jgi:hypothetical protein
MEYPVQIDAARQCDRCGQRLEVIYATPECSAFTTCGCGPRPVLQAAPGLFLYMLAVSITIAASFLISLR